MNKVQIGDNLEIKAKTWNTFIDTANYIKNLQSNQGAKSIKNGIYNGIVLVKNLESSTYPQYSALALTDILIKPSNNEYDFKDGVPTFSGRKMTEDISSTPYVILLEPIASNSVGRGLLLGITPAKVSIIDIDDNYATPTLNSAKGSLESCSTGVARILWKAGTSGEQWCMLQLGGAGSGGESTEYEGSFCMKLRTITNSDSTISNYLDIVDGKSYNETTGKSSNNYFYINTGEISVASKSYDSDLLSQLSNGKKIEFWIDSQNYKSNDWNANYCNSSVLDIDEVYTIQPISDGNAIIRIGNVYMEEDKLQVQQYIDNTYLLNLFMLNQYNGNFALRLRGINESSVYLDVVDSYTYNSDTGASSNMSFKINNLSFTIGSISFELSENHHNSYVILHSVASRNAEDSTIFDFTHSIYLSEEIPSADSYNVYYVIGRIFVTSENQYQIQQTNTDDIPQLYWYFSCNDLVEGA